MHVRGTTAFFTGVGTDADSWNTSDRTASVDSCLGSTRHDQEERRETEISCIMSKLIVVVIGIFTRLLEMGISLSDVGCVLTWEEGCGLI